MPERDVILLPYDETPAPDAEELAIARARFEAATRRASVRPHRGGPLRRRWLPRVAAAAGAAVLAGVVTFLLIAAPDDDGVEPAASPAEAFLRQLDAGAGGSDDVRALRPGEFWHRRSVSVDPLPLETSEPGVADLVEVTSGGRTFLVVSREERLDDWLAADGTRRLLHDHVGEWVPATAGDQAEWEAAGRPAIAPLTAGHHSGPVGPDSAPSDAFGVSQERPYAPGANLRPFATGVNLSELADDPAALARRLLEAYTDPEASADPSLGQDPLSNVMFGVQELLTAPSDLPDDVRRGLLRAVVSHLDATDVAGPARDVLGRDGVLLRWRTEGASGGFIVDPASARVIGTEGVAYETPRIVGSAEIRGDGSRAPFTVCTQRGSFDKGWAGVVVPDGC